MYNSYLVQVQLRQKYYAHQVRLDQGSNPWPRDHDSTLHVPQAPVLTTWPSGTILFSVLANHLIRHQTTHKMGCQPGDYKWPCKDMHAHLYCQLHFFSKLSLSSRFSLNCSHICSKKNDCYLSSWSCRNNMENLQSWLVGKCYQQSSKQNLFRTSLSTFCMPAYAVNSCPQGW